MKSEFKSDTSKIIRFPKNCLSGLVMDMEVEFKIEKKRQEDEEVRITKILIVEYTDPNGESFMFGYGKVKRYFVMEETKFGEESELENYFLGQKEMSTKVLCYLHFKLPEYMKKLLPKEKDYE